MTDTEAWRDCYERAMAVAADAMDTCAELRRLVLDQQRLLDDQQRTLTLALETLEARPLCLHAKGRTS